MNITALAEQELGTAVAAAIPDSPWMACQYRRAPSVGCSQWALSASAPTMIADLELVQTVCSLLFILYHSTKRVGATLALGGMLSPTGLSMGWVSCPTPPTITRWVPQTTHPSNPTCP